MRYAARVDANQEQVKTDSKKKLTKLQTEFFEKWCGGTLCRIDGPEAALRMIGVVK